MSYFDHWNEEFTVANVSKEDKAERKKREEEAKIPYGNNGYTWDDFLAEEDESENGEIGGRRTGLRNQT